MNDSQKIQQALENSQKAIAIAQDTNLKVSHTYGRIEEIYHGLKKYMGFGSVAKKAVNTLSSKLFGEK